MPHNTPEKFKEWCSKPEVRARGAESDRRYYEGKGKAIIQRRRDLLSQFSCICCNESTPCAIDWHHIDDETKSFNIATGMRRGEDVWWNEILKCVPLCANCHRKLHNNLICLIPQKLR